jgi:hypothetical protein
MACGFSSLSEDEEGKMGHGETQRIRMVLLTNLAFHGEYYRGDSYQWPISEGVHGITALSLFLAGVSNECLCVAISTVTSTVNISV